MTTCQTCGHAHTSRKCPRCRRYLWRARLAKDAFVGLILLPYVVLVVVVLAHWIDQGL